MDDLDLTLTMAASDPAMAAAAFGGANAILGMVIPLLENNFNIRERKIRTAVDFDRYSPVIAIRAALSLSIGQGIAFAVHFGLRALGLLIKRNREAKAKTAA